MLFVFFFFFKQKTAYEIRKGDWSSDVCSSDLRLRVPGRIDDRRDLHKPLDMPPEQAARVVHRGARQTSRRLVDVLRNVEAMASPGRLLLLLEQLRQLGRELIEPVD